MNERIIVRSSGTATGHRACLAVAVMLLSFAGILPAHAQQPARAGSPGAAWSIPSNEAIRKLLAQRMQHNGVGIVVGVIEPAGRRVIAHGRSGAADARPLDGDTVFLIGSVTKVFTALVLADMVRRGEVKLQDPASKYLPPGVKMPERGRPITLLDLATHRSALPSMPANFSLRSDPNPYQAYSVDQLHGFLSGYTLPRAPGTKSEYSNLAVALLGRLLARRTGMQYEALLQERVLKPLGMSSTAITLTPEQERRLAPGHDRFLKPVDTWDLPTLPASGSLRSTVNDMLTFLAANLGYSDTPLSSAMAYQRSVRQPANGSQALGWGISKSGTGEIFGHEGGKEGYRSAVAFNPETRTGIVVLANARTDDRPMPIARHLLAGTALVGAPDAPLERRTISLDSAVLDSYAGRYEVAPGQILTVERKGGHLLVDTDGDGVSEFFPEKTRVFFSRTADEQITFRADAAGRIVGLVLREGEQDRPAARLPARA